jgi:hypothetical protein
VSVIMGLRGRRARLISAQQVVKVVADESSRPGVSVCRAFSGACSSSLLHSAFGDTANQGRGCVRTLPLSVNPVPTRLPNEDATPSRRGAVVGACGLPPGGTGQGRLPHHEREELPDAVGVVAAA